ncbi:hypothetical protein OROHE_008261 [Orobanche hederae]
MSSERCGATGSGTPAHTPSSNSISSLNFGDYVPEEKTEEQINEIFEASKSIHNIEDNEDDEQPTKPKQRKLFELKSPLFAVHYTKMDDVASGPGHFLVKCNYCEKIYKFKKGGGYGTLNGHIQRQHPNKIGIEFNQIQLRGTATSSNAPFKIAKLVNPQVREEALLKLLILYYNALFPNPIANFTPPNPCDCVQNEKNSLSALYHEYACSYSGSLDLGTCSSSHVHIPSSSCSSISSFGFVIPDLVGGMHIKKIYPENEQGTKVMLIKKLKII